MIIAAFDIGKKNFCFHVEEFDEKELKEINIPKKKYNKNGTCIPEMEAYLESLYKKGTTLLWKNNDLCEDLDNSKYIDIEVFHRMIELLGEYKDTWDKCDVFLVEQQMAFGRGKQNTLALKLAQHVETYFMINYKREKKIISFPSYHKTKILGAPKKMTKPQRKKWAVNKVTEILNLRTDEKELFEFLKNKKKDDLADTYLMNQCYKHFFIEEM